MQSVSIQPTRYGISLAGLVFLLLVSPQVAAGAVECFSVPSEILGRDVSYCVSLPGGYQDSTRRYPVLYFLHGLFEEPTSWEERGETTSRKTSPARLIPYLAGYRPRP